MTAGTPPRYAAPLAVLLAMAFFLTVFLLGIQQEKGAILAPIIAGAAGFVPILTQLSFVVLVEVSLVLIAHALQLGDVGVGSGSPGDPARRWGMRGFLWLGLVAIVHAILYCSAVAEHSFVLHTATRLDPHVLAYAVENFAMLQSVLRSGADAHLTLRASLAGLCFVAGLLAGLWFSQRLGAHQSLVSRLEVLCRPPVIVALLVLGALFPLGVSWTLGGGGITTIDPLGFWYASLARQPPPPPAAVGLILPDDFYAAPQLLPPAIDSDPASRPNVLLVVLESTRAVSLPPWNHAEEAPLALPFFERMAREGTVALETYAGVTHTTKALPSILCSVAPRLVIDTTETLDNGLPVPCLPHLFTGLGYRTAFLQTAKSTFENRPGLVRNLGFENAAFRETVAREGFDEVGYLGVEDRALIEPALAWTRAAGDNPWFLTLLTLTPHHPYETPEMAAEGVGFDPTLPSYHRTLEYQDQFLADLFADLEAGGALLNTLVVLIGDHGEAFGEHARREHDAVPWPEAAHVPLYLWGSPLAGRPQRVSGLRSVHDVMPTVLDLFDIEWQGTLRGQTVFGPAHERVFTWCWYSRFCGAMRTGPLSVVYHFDRLPTELYDRKSDPLELTNVAPGVDAASIRALESRLLAHWYSVNGFWQHQAPPSSPDELWWASSAPTPADGDPARRSNDASLPSAPDPF